LNDLVRGIRLVAFDFDGDGLGLRKLERLGIACAILSTESNPVVSQRARKLKVRCVQDCRDKRAVLQDLVAELGITLAEVAFVGNDINDLACLRCVGLPVVVRNAHPDVVPIALYRTRTAGGQGAVREVCDLFERASQDCLSLAASERLLTG
jgi:YrbI family 3-deoxy-D-manno-octulosonate 8-phosphate phosphatase